MKLSALLALFAFGLPAAPAFAGDATAAVQHAVANMRVGDVLDIGPGPFQITSPTTIPKLAVTNTFTGGTMIYDGSPENIPGPGVAYRDTLHLSDSSQTTSVHLMVYHVNASGYISGATPQPLKYAVVLEPADPAHPVSVTVRRSVVHGPSTDYFGVGRAASFDYLQPEPEPVLLNVAGPTLIDSSLESKTISSSANRPLLEAHYDFDFTAGDLKLTCVALPPSADTLATYNNPALEPDLAKDIHDRGTFPNDATKLIATSAPYQTKTGLANSGVLQIRVGAGASDTIEADAYAGQGTPAGYDGITGASTFVKGNFGVLYTFHITAQSADGRHVAVLMNPRGGGIAGCESISDGLTGSGVMYAPYSPVAPPISPATNPIPAVLMGRWDPAKTPDFTIKWYPPGASSMPVEWLLVPYAELGDANLDGVVDLTDAALALRSVQGLATLTAVQKTAADVTPTYSNGSIGDGAVTVSDVVWIVQRAAGLV